MRHTSRFVLISLFTLLVCSAPILLKAAIFGERPNLDPNRPTQADLENGLLTVPQIIDFGEVVFSTNFNEHDGYGDGTPGFTTTELRNPGTRPTLEGNDFFLRANGLDSQACFECHSMASTRDIPPRFAIGGHAGNASAVLFRPTFMDTADDPVFSTPINNNRNADFNGRFINPPFVFGAGGVELLAKEMTRDLRLIALDMLVNRIPERKLTTKGIGFGVLRLDLATDEFDFSGVEGLEEPENLLVAPFGRKGDAFSLRNFDVGALMFHFGMQPAERPEIGFDTDPDDDGVFNEILPGDLSALSVFQATRRPPFVQALADQERNGFRRFIRIGCAECHRPVLQTNMTELPISFPEVKALFPGDGGGGGPYIAEKDATGNTHRVGDPFANAFLNLDLTQYGFSGNGLGGLFVPLFADLKRHDMGPGLAEDRDEVGPVENRTFTTARLWGVCDTPPYLHDGRALTLNDAILAHGGEAAISANDYANLTMSAKNEILEFLCALRTPKSPSARVSAESPTTLLEIYEDETAGSSIGADNLVASSR